MMLYRICLANIKSAEQELNQKKNEFLPNAEAYEVGPREQVVSAHEDADIGYHNILKKR